MLFQHPLAVLTVSCAFTLAVGFAHLEGTVSLVVATILINAVVYAPYAIALAVRTDVDRPPTRGQPCGHTPSSPAT